MTQSCPLSTNAPRACPFGGTCHTCPARVQTKLAVSHPGDEYEQEADRVAEQVMGTVDSDGKTHRRASGGGAHPQPWLAAPIESDALPPAVREVLRSSGQPLDAPTRALLEPRFGHDFGLIRVHADDSAARSAAALGALAFTAGHHLVFGPQGYAPGTLSGQQLLAHELAHVLQQTNVPGLAETLHPAGLPGTDIKGLQTVPPRKRPIPRLGDPRPFRHPTSLPGPVIQRQVNRAFSQETFEPVGEVFEENISKRPQERASCIAIVNQGVRTLFTEQLKGRALGSTMEKTMARLRALHLADAPIEIEFLDTRGRPTTGTRPPESLSSGVEAAVLAATGPEEGWFVFGLSIMDGYHSAMLAVDYTGAKALQVFWMDQILGFRGVKGKVDTIVTQLTKTWWKKESEGKGKTGKAIRMRTVVRIWPIVERLVGDYPLPKEPVRSALV